MHSLVRAERHERRVDVPIVVEAIAKMSEVTAVHREALSQIGAIPHRGAVCEAQSCYLR